MKTTNTYAPPGMEFPTNSDCIDDCVEKFPSTEKAEWRDLPFLVLFALHFVGIATILGIGLYSPDVPDNEKLFVFTAQWAETLAILVACGFIFALFYLQLVKKFPGPMVYVGMIVSVSIFLAYAGFLFWQAANYGVVVYYVFGALIVVFAALFALYLFTVRSRIPFAIEMVTNSVDIVTAYPGTQVTACIALSVQIAWTALWTYALYHASTFNSGGAIAMLVFLVFSYYWVSEVIKNVVHVTVSGVVGTWYFLRGSPAMPESPTFGAVRRAMTTSFGSICFGSLIVAILKTIRAIVRAASNRGGIFSCIALCILGCIEGLIRYFNHYAFCQVAIYGKTFCNAATDTWQLLQRSGIAAIANDNLIGGVLLTGSLFGAVVVGGVGALMTLVWPTLGYPGIVFLVGALVGLVMVNVIMQTVDSVVTCTFVCFAENPEALHESNPVLYSRLMEADGLIQASHH